jgi:hypothetical protein
MKKQVMTAAIAAVLMLSGTGRAEPPVRNDDLLALYRDVRGPDCNPTNDAMGMITASTHPDTLLFNHNRGPAGTAAASCSPVLAPDGHQLTLAEFKAAEGRIVASCIESGTHAATHFSGLLPKGTYSVWLFSVSPSAAAPVYLGAGSLGRTEQTENFFTASDGGEGELSATTPEEDLSAFGHIGGCFLDSIVEVHLVYHSDGQTHGAVPGPNDAWVVNARFFFP